MSLSPEPASAIASEMPPVDLAEAGVYPSGQEGFEHGLVVLAMGRPFWLVPAPESGGHRLLVEPDALTPAREQLARYDRESLRWPPPPIALPPIHASDWTTPLCWAGAVMVVFKLQTVRPDWTEAGLLDPAAMFERGEWWRAGTALFLHADLGHAISNALAGLLIFSAVLQTLGRLRGWLLIAAAAVAGNLAVAALNVGTPYRSLGASTAVFAGLGLLTGRALRVVARATHPHRWRGMFIAVASGLVVLALYGAGGVQVDLGAHVMGFVAGLALGFVAAMARPTERLQRSY